MNGHTVPTAKRNAPRGGPTSWLVVRNPACSRALPTPRSSRGTSIGSSVPLALSANTSATPNRNVVTSTTVTSTLPVTIVTHSSATTMRPQEVGDHDQQPPVDPVGDRPGPQPEEQPREPLEQRGHRHEHRVAGLRGHEQRAGRQADPVAQVRRPRRRQQPPEPRPHAGRCDDVEDAAHEVENLPAGWRDVIRVTPLVGRAPGTAPGTASGLLGPIRWAGPPLRRLSTRPVSAGRIRVSFSATPHGRRRAHHGSGGSPLSGRPVRGVAGHQAGG